MKKRLSWAILALVLIFNGVAPVYAAETNPDSKGEWVFLSDEQVSTIVPLDPSANTEMNMGGDLPAPIASTSVHGVVYSITISPIAFAIIGDEVGFVQLDSISKTFNFSLYDQFAGVTLSKSEAQNLLARLESYLKLDADAYLLCGWLMSVTFIFEAPTPISFTWKGTGTNLDPSDSSTLNLRGYGSSVKGTCTYPFVYTEGLDVNAEKYYIRIGGSYTFQLANGTQTYMEVSGTCYING